MSSNSKSEQKHRTVRRALALSILRKRGPSSSREIAREMNMEALSVAGIMRGLCDSGEVKQKRAQHYDRSTIWEAVHPEPEAKPEREDVRKARMQCVSSFSTGEARTVDVSLPREPWEEEART